jgi:molybdate transport system ATP-binding protein
MGRNDRGTLVAATVVSHDARYRLTSLASRAGEWRVPAIDARPGSKIRLWVRTSDVMVAISKPQNISALNVFAGVVSGIGAADIGAVEISIDCNGDRVAARLTAFSVERLGLRPGLSIFVLIKSVAIDQPGTPQD